MQIGRQRAGLGRVDRRIFSERDAAMLAADLVLKDPGTRAAFAQAQPKAGNVIVEMIASRLPCGRARRLVAVSVIFIWSGGFWEDYGKMKTAKRC